MLLNGFTTNSVPLNAPLAVDPNLSIGFAVNDHGFNLTTLNGDAPAFAAGGAGTFTFNGRTLNTASVNGSTIAIPGGTSVTVLQNLGPGDLLYFDALLQSIAEIDAIASQAAPGDLIYGDVEPDVAGGATNYLIQVEINVFGANSAKPLVWINQIIFDGPEAPVVPVEIEVILPQDAPVIPVEVVVFGEGAPVIPIAINVFDEAELVTAPGETLRWQSVVILDGVDISTTLIGDIKVEAEESTARIADFVLLPAAGVVDVTDWVGAPVTIDFQTLDSAGLITSSVRIFTGVVDVPKYDPVSRTTEFRCTDNFQQRMEQTPRDTIDALVGGRWSDLIFDTEEDNWTYTQDQLSTVSSAFELSPLGALRGATPWAAKVSPDYTFDEDNVLDESIDAELESFRNIVNLYKLNFDYSFERLRRRDVAFGWGFPGTFCQFLESRMKLPKKQSITSAAEATGWAIESLTFEDLPPSALINCGGVDRIWVNTENGFGPLFCLSASGRLAKRFGQAIREDYTLNIRGSASVDDFGAVTEENQFSVRSEYDTGSWEDSENVPDTPGLATVAGGTDDFFEDRDNEAVAGRGDMEAAMEVAIDVGKTAIRGAHRQNTVSVNLSMQPQLDLIHTVKIDTLPVQAQGKVRQLTWTMNIDAGTAITECEVAISKAGGAPVVETPTAPPTKPDTISQMTSALRRPVLNTRYGGDSGNSPPGEFSLGQSQPIDPEVSFPGWTGNLDPLDGGAIVYDETFDIDTADVDAVDRDEIIGESDTDVLVDIPNETLILTA